MKSRGVVCTALLFSSAILPKAEASSAYSCETFEYTWQIGSASYALPLSPTGINNKGQVVGNGTQVTMLGTLGHGFLRDSDGSIGPIDYPDADPSSESTWAYSINNLGQIAGTYTTDQNSVQHGFIRDRDGSFVTVDLPPPSSETQSYDLRNFWVYGINDTGWLSGVVRVVDTAVEQSPFWEFFTRDADGQFAFFDADPTVISAQAGPINNNGSFIEHWFSDVSTDVLRTPGAESLYFIYPGSLSTSGPESFTQVTANGLNNQDSVAGYFRPLGQNAQAYGFVHPPGGRWPSVVCPEHPDAIVYPQSVNDDNWLAGKLILSKSEASKQIAFIATPSGVNPAAQLSNSSWTFASHSPSETSPDGTIFLTNVGSADLHVQTIQLGKASAADHPEDFMVTTDNCSVSLTNPGTLPPGQTCSFSVAFKPTGIGARQAELVVSTDAPDGPHEIGLNGTGLGKELTFSDDQWVFATHPLSETSGPGVVYVYNSGTDVVTFSSVQIGGAQAEDFAVTQNTCSPALQPATTCQVMFTFTPRAQGKRSALLTFQYDADPSVHSVQMFGMGQ